MGEFIKIKFGQEENINKEKTWALGLKRLTLAMESIATRM